MTVGTINLNCPACRNLQSVPLSMAGQTARCTVCQSVFIVPPMATPNVPSKAPPAAIIRGPQSAAGPPMAKPIGSRWANGPIDPMAPMVPVPLPPAPANRPPASGPPTADPQPEVVVRNPLAPLINIAVVIVCGLLLLLGTVVAILDAQGKLVFPDRQVAENDSTKKQSEKPTEEARSAADESVATTSDPSPPDNARSDKPSEFVRVKEKEYPLGVPRVVDVDPKSVGPLKWQDARDVSLVLQRVKARVDRIEIGIVMGRDPTNNIVPVDERSYLSVFVTLKNQGQFPLEYHSWNREGGSSRTRHKPASLVDNLGRSYEIKTFQGMQRVRGVASEKKLVPGDEIQDVIVFAHPIGEMEEVKYFMLSLPGSAFGGEGTYRFEVPISMMKGW